MPSDLALAMSIDGAVLAIGIAVGALTWIAGFLFGRRW